MTCSNATNLSRLHGLQKDHTFLLQVNVAIDLETVYLKGEMPMAEKAHSNYCLVTSFQSYHWTTLLFEGGFEVVE